MCAVAASPVPRPFDRVRPRILALTGSIAIWLIAALIAVFFAVIDKDSAVLDDHWLPRGNDSFYHARRILDAAVGTRGFYQFDERLQLPEGAWISWPWAYDYLMAKATQLALWAAPSLDPMAFMAYMPVAWIFVNAALFLAAARAIGLSPEMRALAMLCFALSPLTQLLHWVGMVDHHYVEHTFVLLCAWLGVRWFKQPDDRLKAIALGLALGVATAFHNGLFVLQLFPLLTVFILWLRHSAPPAATLRTFGGVLAVTTLLVLLPSEPFRRGMFEFGLHSWFHLYVAVCTALSVAYMGWRTASHRAIGGLVALSVALSIPIGAQLAGGAGFLSGSFSVLDQIVEVQSPYEMFTKTMGPYATLGYYSGLLLLAPVVLAVYAHRAVFDHRPQLVYFGVCAVLGLLLLLAQLRLHYFGYFGLVAGTLLIVDELRSRLAWHRAGTFAATFAALVLAFQPALRERLFVIYAPSSDPEYAAAFPLFLDLEQLCAENPGTVLSSPDDGNAILFHTECGVIANNFILRPEDEAHINEVGRLMLLPAAEIRAERPDVKYLLLRAADYGVEGAGAHHLLAESPIAKQFFVAATPPAGFALVREIPRTLDADGPADIYARLFKVTESDSFARPQ
jgi:hypothetical protein